MAAQMSAQRVDESHEHYGVSEAKLCVPFARPVVDAASSLH